MGVMFDLMCVGDCTVDLFLEIHEAEVNCDLDPHECKLVLDFADKIPVTRLTKVVGAGNAANVAVGANRLGIKTALVTLIGDDSEGREMRQVFSDEGVAGDYVMTDSGKRSNLSVIINFRGERTILAYHEAREYRWPEVVQIGWVYLTSAGKGFEKLYDEARGYVAKIGAKLVFAPGSTQMRAGKEELRGTMEQADLMIVNKREAQELLGHETEVVGELLTGLRNWGPKTAIITDGERGSWADDGAGVKFVGAEPAVTVERTGAGDAYAAGLVAGLIEGKNITEAMRWGSVNAASVIGQIGSRAGLLRKID